MPRGSAKTISASVATRTLPMMVRCCKVIPGGVATGRDAAPSATASGCGGPMKRAAASNATNAAATHHPARGILLNIGPARRELSHHLGDGLRSPVRLGAEAADRKTHGLL